MTDHQDLVARLREPTVTHHQVSDDSYGEPYETVTHTHPPPPLQVEAADAIEAMAKDAAAKQAKIDALMLEYCPDEMTAEQLDEWGRHQVVSPDTARINAAIGTPPPLPPPPAK